MRLTTALVVSAITLAVAPVWASDTGPAATILERNSSNVSTDISGHYIVDMRSTLFVKLNPSLGRQSDQVLIQSLKDATEVAKLTKEALDT